MQFWTGPFRRYLPGLLGVTVDMELSTVPPEVPGSYSIEAVARVKARGARDRAFSLFRLRRYDTSGLLSACRSCGWDIVDGWPYGGEVGYPRALALLRKRDPVQ